MISDTLKTDRPQDLFPLHLKQSASGNPRKDADCHFPGWKQPCLGSPSPCVQLWGSWTRRNEPDRAEVMGGKPGRPLTSGAGRDLVGTVDFGARMPEY